MNFLLPSFKTSLAPAVVGSLWLAVAAHSPAAPGDLDLSFDPAGGVNGAVYSIVAQADGKTLIGGDFSTVRGAVRSGIARLSADGVVDRTFDPGRGVGFIQTNRFGGLPMKGLIRSMALQADGKLLLGGRFNTVDGATRNRIARLGTDGSLDTTFHAGTEGSGDVLSVVLQPNGRIVIGGSFTNVNGAARSGIARLNPDGSLDASFDPSTGVSGWVSSIAVQTDGKLVIVGSYQSINGTNRNSIARLNTDGGLDTTFDSGTGVGTDPFFSAVNSVVLQADGKAMITGNFISINGTNRSRIARLNTNGSLDASFDPGMVVADGGVIYNPAVFCVAVQSDGKVLVGGQFTSINATNRNYVARLNADGSLDTAFDPGMGTNAEVECVVLQADGRVLLGGDFSTVNGTNRNYVARLQADGGLDSSFLSTMPPSALPPDASSAILQPDGKLLLGMGSFFVDYFEWPNWVTLGRLNADGSWDGTFDTSTSANGNVLAVALQADNKVLVGGGFSAIGGMSRNGIARLNPDGGLDNTFDPGLGGNWGSIRAVAVQPDGRVLVGGNFTQMNGTNRNRIARLNADGSLDESFAPGTGANGQVLAVALQADGKVLLGGDFSAVNGTNRNRIARLNPDGSLDTTFQPVYGPNRPVRAIAVQFDGNIVIGGDFTALGAVGRRYVARLGSNGAFDATFDCGQWARVGIPSSYVGCITLQRDGKVLVGGAFFVTNGVSGNNLARLNGDGTLDHTFGPIHVEGVNGDAVISIALAQDGKVMIGGAFETVNGLPRARVARLWGDGAVLVSGPVLENGDVVVRYRGIPGLDYTIQCSEDLSPPSWQKLVNLIAPTNDTGWGAGTFELRDPVLPSGRRYYRAVYPAY